jgi:hypothetical protein
LNTGAVSGRTLGIPARVFMAMDMGCIYLATIQPREIASLATRRVTIFTRP